MKQVWEAMRPVGFDEIVQAPVSYVDPPAYPEPETATDIPATPEVGARVTVGKMATVNVVSANVDEGVGGDASLTLIVKGGRRGFAAGFTAKDALTVPDVEIVHVVVGLEANRRPDGDDKVHVVAEPLVANPPPVTVTLADPSDGKVPKPGGTLPGETTIVGEETRLKAAVAVAAGTDVTVTT